jgi:tyrosyl-tRNA synthetase
MTVDEKINLITRNLEEVLTEEDLKYFLDNNIPLKHYIGFEISGRVHVGGGLITAMKLKDFIEAGMEVTIFLADWHAWINHKLGGDIETIRKAADYMEQVLRAAMKCVGGNDKKINFLLGTKLYQQCKDYFEIVMQVAQKTSLARIQRSISIMGREERESQEFAMLIYPVMQVADIFAQGLSIVHSGMDQRKAHVIMRDVAHQVEKNPLVGLKGERLKPVALHHHLLMGLTEADIKMSKSKPESAIFMTDSEEDIERKIMAAFCPEGKIEANPILDWTKHLIWPICSGLNIKRAEKHGGDVEYQAYEDLEKDFTNKKLHAQDLKQALVVSLIDILAPAREHFARGKNQQVLAEMKKLTVTR